LAASLLAALAGGAPAALIGALGLLVGLALVRLGRGGLASGLLALIGRAPLSGGLRALGWRRRGPRTALLGLVRGDPVALEHAPRSGYAQAGGEPMPLAQLQGGQSGTAGLGPAAGRRGLGRGSCVVGTRTGRGGSFVLADR